MRACCQNTDTSLLASAPTLAAFVAASALVATADALAMESARERAIRECGAPQRRDSHDPYDRRAGVMYRYDACMAERGQTG
jgi:hypothetical protein